MENLKKKLEIINCGDLLEEIEGTDFQKIMDSILIKKNELKETIEEEKEIEGEKKFKDTLIYKSLIFYRNIDLENKQVFKQIDVQSICEFFSLNPKYDKFIEKYINNLGNDPLIYGKNKIEIFYILLIALNYLEKNNKKTLIIENQIKKYKLTLYFIKHLKSIERNYYFNIFNLVSNNKYLLYLQPVYNTEMETLFLNYFYINKIGME